MAQKRKKTSDLRDSDQVVLLIDSKKSFQNNEATETKPMNTVTLTWFAAKAALEKGTIDQRKISLSGYIGEDGKIAALTDDTDVSGDYDNDEFSDEDLNDAQGLIQGVLDQREKKLQEREDELSQKEIAFQAMEKRIKELEKANPVKKVAPKKEEKSDLVIGKTDSSAPITNVGNGLLE